MTSASKKTSSSTHDNQAFLSGLGLGMIVGAAGFVLFGTKRGEQIRHQLIDRWQDVRETLDTSQGIQVYEQPPVTLREFLLQMFQLVKDELELQPLQSSQTKSSTSMDASKQKTSPNKPKQSLFRGVKSQKP